MAKQPVGVWGIDLGQCGLKAIRLIESDGQVTVSAFDFVEHPKILSQPDADPDQLTREALEKFLSRNQLKGDIVCISVPGQSGLARFVKLPPVEEKKIGDIVRFEAKQQIPFNLEEVVWDYQKLSSGTVTDGFAMETEIGLFAMKRDMVNRYLQHFKDVNVDVHVVQMSPLALCNYVAYDLLAKGPQSEDTKSKRSCIVALDIGTDSSNLVITDGARIIWPRPIPLGGNHFTRALTKDLKLTFAKAEHLKRNAIKSPDLKKILAAIKPVLNDFVSEVQRSLGFFTNTHRDASIEYMIGLGNAFRLPGLQRYLGEKLQLEVKKLEKLERLSGESVLAAPAFTENILTFPVAYGLALQGLKQSRLLTNLLPPEIRTERLIKAKKPFAVAAAAALLLAVGGMTLGYGKMFGAYGGPAAEEFHKTKKPPTSTNDKLLLALGAAQAEITSIETDKAEYNKAKKAAEEEGRKVESIVTGLKEQMNWLALSKFLDEAIPRPEAVNDQAFQRVIPGPEPKKADQEAHSLWQKRVDWVTEGQTSFEAWQRWREGKPLVRNPGPLGDGVSHLFQFNIEAVSCRYTPNLKGFWENVQNKVLKDNKSYVRPLTDKDNVPGENEKGWIIELRGYTYHEDQTNFVLNVLLDHIAWVGAQKKAPWPLGASPSGIEQAASPASPAKSGQPPGEADQKARVISHVVLVKVTRREVADASLPYEDIDSPNLEKLKLLAASASSSKGGGGGSQPAGGGGSQMPGGSGGMGMGGGKGQTTSWTALGSETIGPPGGDQKKKEDTQSTNLPYKRTEFVVLFIWREPTESSDSLLKAVEAGGDQPSGGGMPGGGPGR
ncbi:MAG: type IV pilus assembly protein PilM [Planctomycetes bacterium]|nr:type IV pilus assembly protein PilM [Planctomycetota bacterium]